MATERFNINDPAIDVRYFRTYADLLKPYVVGDVLDLGCGEGWLTKELAPLADHIVALDKFGDQSEVNKDPKIEYIQTDIPSFKTTQTFDTIISTEFVEHITEADLRKLLPKIRKWLKGKFLGSTPDKKSPTINPYHLKEYTTAELEALFLEFGFEGEFINPIEGLTVWIVSAS